MNDLQEKAANGAALLDKHREGWFRKIDRDQLDLSRVDKCICSQLATAEAPRVTVVKFSGDDGEVTDQEVARDLMDMLFGPSWLYYAYQLAKDEKGGTPDENPFPWLIRHGFIILNEDDELDEAAREELNRQYEDLTEAWRVEIGVRLSSEAVHAELDRIQSESLTSA